MKWFLFVRHVESAKNLDAKFAHGADRLTAAGEQDAEDLGRRLNEFIPYLASARNRVEIHSSTSTRASRTAQIIARETGVTHIEQRDLCSIHIPMTTGRTFAEILVQDSKFARQFNLYRAGLLDGYQIARFGPAVADFEQRMGQLLTQLAERPPVLLIVVAHRSVLTAALVHIARLAGHYPRDRTSFVPLRLGSCTLASRDNRHGWRLHFADVLPVDLGRVGRGLIDPMA